MWILRYLILATRQRSNALLDRRTRMTFDPLHGCPMYVCRDKADWDQRGRDQVAQLESELRQDIEAYNTETHERRVIRGEMIEVRPVMLEKPPEPMEAFKEFLGATESPEEKEAVEQEQILPEAAPEMEAAAPVSTGDALVSSGVEAQAEAEPGADPTTLTESPSFAKASEGALRAEDAPEPLAVPQATVPTATATPKTKTKPAGKAAKK